jgi:hypothetical protein
MKNKRSKKKEFKISRKSISLNFKIYRPMKKLKTSNLRTNPNPAKKSPPLEAKSYASSR